MRTQPPFLEICRESFLSSHGWRQVRDFTRGRMEIAHPPLCFLK
ncbi:MAG: hypothetical protein WBV23_14740 [Desulfobaccales bacterium]